MHPGDIVGGSVDFQTDLWWCRVQITSNAGCMQIKMKSNLGRENNRVQDVVVVAVDLRVVSIVPIRSRRAGVNIRAIAWIAVAFGRLPSCS